MVLVPMVNMVLLLLGFLTGLVEKKKPAVSHPPETDLALPQLAGSQKG
jgi:hypothetical protein